MPENLRNTMAAYTDRMDELTPGKSGDYSLRSQSEFSITPTGVSYSEMKPGDFPILDLNGELLEGSLDPSSELPVHRSLYDGLDCSAIVHVHSPWATTLGALGESLSYVHYAAALAGPEVPLVEYYTYGSETLAAAVLEEMQRAATSACFLANHGQVVVGDSLEHAFEAAEAVEFTARIECQARMIGAPNELSAEEVLEARRKFEDYGQENPSESDDSENN
ncbi:MAG: class II aldolase/adducin family protein [bacterium]